MKPPYYVRFDMSILLDILENEDIKKSVAYMIDFREHDNLVVVPKPNYIEISNTDICIAIIVFSGFEKEDYEELRKKENYQVVSFDLIAQEMFEFEKIQIKHIDYMSLFFMSMARSNDKKIKDFVRLNNLSTYHTKIRLRKNQF